ncbi:MAG: hypothetical protein LAT84_13075 [Balneolia bacterium]|nr:hypothetical protein [Balneolia bacterium]
MSRNRITLIAVFILVALLATFAGSNQNDNWTPLYSNSFSSPFGTQFLYEMLSEDPSRVIREIPAPLADYERIRLETKGQTLMIINGGYNPDRFELELLQQRVDDGMNLFIAARPGPGLARWLGLTTRAVEGGNVLIDYVRELIVTEATLDFPGLQTADGQIPEFRTDASFLTATLGIRGWSASEREDESGEEEHADTGEDESGPEPEPQTDEITTPDVRITWLAEHDGKAIFARIEREGAGTVWLLTSPLLLTNYHIWNPDFEATTAAVISHLPHTPLLWDEYYKPLGPLAGNPLSVMLDNRALSAAWFSMLALVLLFLLFRVKRTQRAVPVIEPPRNATLAHLERVSALFQQKDRELRVLDERIRYLAFALDMDEPSADEAIMKPLAEKHRVPEEQLSRVMRSYGVPPAGKNELNELNSEIDKLLSSIMSLQER